MWTPSDFLMKLRHFQSNVAKILKIRYILHFFLYSFTSLNMLLIACMSAAVQHYKAYALHYKANVLHYKINALHYKSYAYLVTKLSYICKVHIIVIRKSI